MNRERQIVAARPMQSNEPLPQVEAANPTRPGGGQAWLWVLLALALARGVAYTFVVPPWQHPDEPSHFEHVRLIAETGRIPDEYVVSLPLRREIAASMQARAFWRGIEQPSLDDENLSEVGISPIGVTTLTQPRLYYILAALWLRPWLGQPVETQLYAVRLLAVLLNAVVVACTFAAARLLWPSRPWLAAAAAGFVVFQPGMTDIMSAANNDALVNALAAVFYLIAAQAHRIGWSWKRIGLAGAAVALGIFTKSTGIVTLAAWLLAPVFSTWGRRSLGLVLIGAITVACLVAAPVAAILSGVAGVVTEFFIVILEHYFRIGMPETLRALVEPRGPLGYYGVSIVVFRSFWAAFGWRHVLLAGSWYWAPGLAMLAAGAGLAAQAIGRPASPAGRPALASVEARAGHYLLFSLAATALAWAAAIIRSWAAQGMGAYLSHGRYAFVAIAPFALLMTVGLLGWLPEAWQRRAGWIFLAAWAAFDALAFWGALVPYYYGSL